MNYVELIETSDGKLHKTTAKAKAHANTRYSNAVNKLAGKLFNIIHGPSRMIDIAEFIDEHRYEFAELVPLKDDIELGD
jgi:hypothetical protein